MTENRIAHQIQSGTYLVSIVDQPRLIEQVETWTDGTDTETTAITVWYGDAMIEIVVAPDMLLTVQT